MSKIKKRTLFSIFCIVLCLFGGYITLEWFLFATGQADPAYPEILLTRILKITSCFLVCFMVFLTGKDFLEKEDSKRMILVFGAIVFADIAFFIDQTYVGIGFFGIAQTLFIIRHGMAIKQSAPKNKNPLMWNIITAIIIGVLDYFIVFVIFHGILGTSVLFFIIFGYSILLCVSLWFSWTAARHTFYPKTNAILIAIGMTLFFIGDILVGFNLVLEPGSMNIITKYFVWVFYFPSLILLGASNFNLNFKTTVEPPQNQEIGTVAASK